MNIKYIKTTDNKKYDLRDKRITDTDTGVATQSTNGLLSSTDKKKLDGIASGAEVNQNAFSNIKIGNTTIAADSKTDTVELAVGNNITLTPDATNDKITIAATDTNTTYTFAGGTNQFTVTPSNGTAQTVSVTPSIANNVTGSGLTAGAIVLGNGNSTIKTSSKTIVTTLGNDDTTLPTSKAVKDAIDALPEPMIFKGTLGTGGTITSLPAAASGNNGFTYKVITAGTYASLSAKIGDVFISNGSSWNLIPSGDEPSGTVTNIATGTGLTGGPITSSGTISHADTSSQASVSNSGRTYIQSVTLDGMGHVTGLSSATETVVNTDRYVNNAAFADDSTSAPASPVKMTLTRAGSDTATVTANLPKVSSASAGVAPKGAAVTTQSQSTKFLREDGTWAAPSYSRSTVNSHYTPAEDTSSQLDADASSTTAATWNSTSLVTGVTVKRDAKGHVVGLGVDSIKMPANPNTDIHALQRLTVNDGDYPILTSGVSITDTTPDFTGITLRNNYIYANPSEGSISATLKGSVSGRLLRRADVETVSATTPRYVYVKLGTFTYSSFGTLCVHLEGNALKDELYINYGSGNATAPMVCGWYATNSANVKEIDLVYDTSWSGNCELWLRVYQSTTLNIAVIKAIRGVGFTVNTSANWSATTTSPTFNKTVPLIRGMFGDLSGNASSASKLTTDAGSATQPVYFSEGVPTACSYQLNKTVPSNAVFTDTHYTTHLYAGSGTAANAATTNGNTKLTVVDNTTTRESVTIKGTGGTTVSSDAGGVVTINSADTFSKQFTFDSPSVYQSNYDFIILPKGYNACSSGTCYFVEIMVLIQQQDSWVTRCVKFMTHCKWFGQNSGLRITLPVYAYGLISNGPILYHDKAEGVDVGTETHATNVCIIPFNIPVSSGIAAVNIKVEGPDVSKCICDRAYSNWKWSNVEPSWTTA